MQWLVNYSPPTSYALATRKVAGPATFQASPLAPARLHLPVLPSWPLASRAPRPDRTIYQVSLSHASALGKGIDLQIRRAIFAIEVAGGGQIKKIRQLLLIASN